MPKSNVVRSGQMLTCNPADAQCHRDAVAANDNFDAHDAQEVA
jgi:hypothetical protein